MTKYWKTNATRDGNPVALYVTTNDETIAADLALGAGHSLTLMGRQDNYRRNPRRTRITSILRRVLSAVLHTIKGFNLAILARKLI